MRVSITTNCYTAVSLEMQGHNHSVKGVITVLLGTESQFGVEVESDRL